MGYVSKDEIRGVLIHVGVEYLLLPNATIAEVLARAEIQPLVDVPQWLVGTIDWYGWKVPVLSFARLNGHKDTLPEDKNKVVVLKALGGVASLPYFAILTDSFPRLITIPRDGLLADASEDALPPGVHMRILLGEQSALLPDLESIESAIVEVFSESA